mmetsp:Transcript_44032/g.134096  ORF Transcript_44032/g.134096 Transcript_44032/m.134096 type:complete len:125 (-) Transcript_44032:307-681(-)
MTRNSFSSYALVAAMLVSLCIGGDVVSASSSSAGGSSDSAKRNLRTHHRRKCNRCSGAGHNPCEHRDNNNQPPFYYRHCADDKFIQCTTDPKSCFEMTCQGDTKWNDDLKTCCHPSSNQEDKDD